MTKTYTTKQMLNELGVPFYTLEYLVRTGRVKPLEDGRRPGRTRHFTADELAKARELTKHLQLSPEDGN